jgi:DNA gyrase subunit A
MIALGDLDKIIATIRGAASADDAKQKLMAKPWEMSDRQAQAVLDLQLRRLAALERKKIEEDYQETIKRISYLEDLLANPRKIDYLIRDDTAEIKKDYGDERRTEIIDAGAEEISDEDLVAHQEVVVTLSNRGYVKRLPLETYRLQRRGGKGITGMVTREEDAVHKLIVCDTHDNVLFFTERGKVFTARAYDLPDAKRQAKGTPLVNFIDCEAGEQITALVTIRDYEHDYMLMVTARGEVKKTPLKEFKEVRSNGKIAMDLEKGDDFVAAKLVHEDDEVVIVTSDGQAIRFAVSELRSASRTSGGVRGIRLGKNGKVVAMEVVGEGELFTITERGYGKRTPFGDYPAKHRGGQGVRNYEITQKTGRVVAARAVDASQELIVISRDGIVIRTRMDQIRMTGRQAQGVSVISVNTGDAVASLATIVMGGGDGNGNGKPPSQKAEQPEMQLDAARPARPPVKPTPIKGRPSAGRTQAPMQARKPATARKATRQPVSAPKPAAASKPGTRKAAPARRPASAPKSAPARKTAATAKPPPIRSRKPAPKRTPPKKK